VATLIGGCGGGGGVAHVSSRPADEVHAVAASCVGLTAAQQFAAARIVFDGTMLPGPTVRLGRGRVLSSPARVRIIRYLKGNGPLTVRVETAAARTGGGIAVSGPCPRAVPVT
jgi:hypothetical protein